jgi:hypothetical protein
MLMTTVFKIYGAKEGLRYLVTPEPLNIFVQTLQPLARPHKPSAFAAIYALLRSFHSVQEKEV